MEYLTAVEFEYLATTHQVQHDQTLPLSANGVACETNAVVCLNDVSESLYIHAVSIGLVAEHQVSFNKSLCLPHTSSCIPLCLELSGDFHVALVNHPVITDKLGPESKKNSCFIFSCRTQTLQCWFISQSDEKKKIQQ